MIQIINEQMYKQMKWQNNHVLVYYSKLFASVCIKNDVKMYSVLIYLLICETVHMYSFTYTESTYMCMFK